MNVRLWAITSYFNPCGYRRRRANYEVFRRRLAAPLLTVELSYGDAFDLPSAAADRLVRVRGRDVMFQKERLLNIAVQHLPSDCEAVAWIDCDVFFGDADWMEQTSSALEQAPLVQLYGRLCNLPANCPAAADPAAAEVRLEAVARKMARGAMTMDDFREDAAPVAGTAWGTAWAARADLLREHGLYDSCILGSGDAALYSAAIGGFGRAREAMRMNEARYRHYLAWAEPFHRAVRGRVGCLPGDLFHLWHGDFAKRRYRERHQDAERFDFDPARDIRIDGGGCWRWNSNKAELHDYVARYFRDRDEDGSEG